MWCSYFNDALLLRLGLNNNDIIKIIIVVDGQSKMNLLFLFVDFLVFNCLRLIMGKDVNQGFNHVLIIFVFDFELHLLCLVVINITRRA